MTIRERLQTIGQAFRSKPEVVVREVEAKQKASAGYVDIFNNTTGLVTQTRASSKLLDANEGWVYKNNDAIAKEVATIEFELFTTRVVAGEIELVPILSHPILDALDRFNEFTDASSGFYLTSSHKTLAGDAIWYIDGTPPNIRGIYLLQPDKVEIKLGKPSFGQAIIQAYEFKDSVNGKQVTETYKAEEIVHFKAPNPNNAYRGKSKVQAAAEAIDTDNFAIEANKGLFQRGLIGNFVLSTQNAMTPEQMKVVRTELQANYGGVTNAYKAMILSGGLKPETIQLTNKEMEFIDQQKWNRDKIMSIFGNVPPVLGITDDVNRANADATIMHWKRTTVKPEMKAITDTLNEFFVPKFGDNLILGFKDPVPEDRETKVKEAVDLHTANIITTNEARESLGLEASTEEGADILAQPTPEAIPVDLPKSVKNVDYMRVFRKHGVFEERTKQIEARQAAIAIRDTARQIIKGKRKVVTKATETPEHESFTNEQVWSFHRRQIDVVEHTEQKFHNKVTQYIDGLVDRALEAVPGEVAEMSKALINEDAEITRAMIDFTPILTEVAALSGQLAMSLVGDSTYIPTDITGFIEREVKRFATSMIETDRDKMIDLLVQGIADGKSIPQIKADIRQVFTEYSKTQADRVTRTEVIKASNYATMDAWDKSGVVVAKQWLTALDDRVDPLCAEMNGKIIPLKKNYFDKGDTLEVGDVSTKFDYASVKNPPLHVNCRCTMLPVLVDQKAFDTETYIKMKTLERDAEELTSKIDTMDKRTKEAKQIIATRDERITELENLIDEISAAD